MMHPRVRTRSVVSAQSAADVDHFAGLESALGARGLLYERFVREQMPPLLDDCTSVVVVSDTSSFLTHRMLGEARRVGAVTVLLMDGIVEWRNTFANPRTGDRFLRPAPVDVVACAGAIDERLLRAWGNHAVATGLPRIAASILTSSLDPQLNNSVDAGEEVAEGNKGRAPTRDGSGGVADHLGSRGDSNNDSRSTVCLGRRSIMIATARTPAFVFGEREQLLEALGALKQCVEAASIAITWRLTDHLDVDLGVINDDRPLPELLAQIGAVITTPSTLMVESMRAGCPTALLRVYSTPSWQPSVWTFRPGRDQRGWPALIQQLIAPDARQMHRQRRMLEALHQEARPPVEALADLIAELVDRPKRARRIIDLPTLTRVPRRLAPPGRTCPGRKRVVNCVHCDGTPVGGVTTWALRLAQAFAESDLGYDVRTLLISSNADTSALESFARQARDLTEICVVDPTLDHIEFLDSVRSAIESMEPTIVMPNYADFCYAAAIQLRSRGVRMVAVAHTDDKYYRESMAIYNRWDAAVGVSDACMGWLGELAGARPCAKIVYGVPVAAQPRAPKCSGPIVLAYVGRMVRWQKRIDHLLGLLDQLEKRQTNYELHMVGSGPDLAWWKQQVAARSLEVGRVILHGEQEPQWVQTFLAGIDISVLVSDFEGTSITMLEAMGAGVVPAVTAVSSGVQEWIRDGGNGVIAPVGEPEQLADRIADLAADRGRLARMGREAWETVRDRVSMPTMARQYADLFDAVLREPMDQTPTDLGLQLIDRWRWRMIRGSDYAKAVSWIESKLAEAGYRCISHDAPTPDSDAVILHLRHGFPSTRQVTKWRNAGLGVVLAPHLLSERECARRLDAAIKNVVKHRHRRIAVFGTGRHTEQAAEVFYLGHPIVGLIDDCPPIGDRLFGHRVTTPEEAISILDPDAIVLSSDACEAALWQRCEIFRAHGIPVYPIYGDYAEQETTAAPSAMQTT